MNVNDKEMQGDECPRTESKGMDAEIGTEKNTTQQTLSLLIYYCPCKSITFLGPVESLAQL